MKKKILTLMTAFVLIANILLANTNGNGIPETVVSEFSRTFTDAKEIHWENYGNYYKATFRAHRNTFYVFYSDNSEIMGIALNILSDKLPDSLQAGIKIKYAGYWITDLVKYHIADKTGFLVTMENENEKLTLKTTDSQQWQVYSKSIKS